MADDPRFFGYLDKGDTVVVSYRSRNARAKAKQESRVLTVIGDPNGETIRLAGETDGPFLLVLDRERRAKELKSQTASGYSSMGFVTNIKTVDG